MNYRHLIVPALLAALVAGSALAASVPAGQLLLDVDFAPRDIAQVEIGDFHFRPGQVAPIHTHAAPAIGYVSKGTIYYQVEGMPAQILKAGDAFYEPVGPKILHFDNASKTDEAVFTDFNLEQAGEPFIKFDRPPTEKIDRRSFPTAPIVAAQVGRAVAHAIDIAAQKPLVRNFEGAVVGYVARGSVVLTVDGGTRQLIAQGRSFAAPAGHVTRIAAQGAMARVVTFELKR